MSTEENIIRLFCSVDDIIGPVKKRSDAHLHDSEIVTIGLLFSLKGGREKRVLSLAKRELSRTVSKTSGCHAIIALIEKSCRVCRRISGYPVLF